MSTTYDGNFSPPAPMLMVELAFPDEAPRVGPIAALVDTGSDGSFVPIAYLEQLNAPLSHEANVHPIFGPPRRLSIYTVDLLFGSARMTEVEVVGSEENAEVVLGRNVLNRLILLLDGPHLETDLLDRRPKFLREE